MTTAMLVKRSLKGKKELSTLEIPIKVPEKKQGNILHSSKKSRGPQGATIPYLGRHSLGIQKFYLCFSLPKCRVHSGGGWKLTMKERQKYQQNMLKFFKNESTNGFWNMLYLSSNL